MSVLSAADLRFINRVAAQRFGGDTPAAPDDAALREALSDADAPTAQLRAARLAAALLRRGVFGSSPLPTALLALHCSLALEGLSLLAPQGVTAGMLRGLAAGEDPGGVARWLEDRAVPAG